MRYELLFTISIGISQSQLNNIGFESWWRWW